MSQEGKKSRTRNFNLNSRKTEEEWAETWQAITEDAATAWFKWISWCFYIGGIAYIADKTGSGILKNVESFSYIILMFYFQQFFMSFRIEPYESWVQSQKTKLRLFIAILPAALLSVALAFATNKLILYVIEQIKLSK
jgi:hypothetical protein